MDRLLQFLSICYRYNSHNQYHKIVIPIIKHKNNTLILYKLHIGKFCFKSCFKVMGFETNLAFNDVVTTINRFFNTIPCYPEVCYMDFENFGEFSANYKCYCDISDFI